MFRQVVRHPSAHFTMVLTLASGIASVVAMFSVYSALVLYPMSVRAPEDLVSIQATNPKVNTVPTALSWVRFDHSLRHAQSFTNIAAYDADSISLTTPGRPPEQLAVLRVSHEFFAVLGTDPIEGRVFTAAEDQPNGPAVCILSHELWTTRFARAPLVGQTIDLDGRPTQVVGVMAPRFTAPWSSADLFLPRLFETGTVLPEHIRNGASFLSVIGRLRSGVTLAQAQAELDALSARYSADFAGRMDAANLAQAQGFLDGLVSGRHSTVGALLGAVGAVLLVACANVSTLFLGRLLTRRRELAVRQALGASRARLVREIMGESLTVSLAAGVVGLGSAWLLLGLVTWSVGDALPVGTQLSLDVRVMAATVLVVLATSLLVGFVPALSVTRRMTAPLLSFDRSVAATGMARRLRGLLVVGEVTLSCALLIGAALLLTSLIRLQRSDAGFDTRSTAAGLVSLPLDRYDSPERQVAFANAVVDELLRKPGVMNAAAVFGLPLGDSFSFHQYVVAGQPIPPPSERQRAGIRLVTERYFEVMGMRVIAGRAFTEADRLGAPLVCIVNESLARRMFGGRPLGQAILRGRDADLRYEIVGVVADARTYGVRQAVVDEVFYAYRQLPWPQLAIVARTDGDPQFLRRQIETAVASVDTSRPVARFRTMAQRLDDTWGAEKAMSAITLAFAGLALLMAIVGLYAVLTQSVAARTTEIGVRVALGARRSGILRVVLGQGMSTVAIGTLAGVAVAAAASRFLTAQLYAVQPIDPWIYGTVAGVFVLVALIACLLPAWRAARLDPVKALRGA